MTTTFASRRDQQSMVQCVMGAAYVLATAGGAGDNTAVTGTTLNRNSLYSNGLSTLTDTLPEYVIFNVAYEAILAAAATLTIKSVVIEHSSDGSAWSTFLTQASTPRPNGWPAAGVVDTGGVGGSTQRGVVKFGADLTGAKQYIRFLYTPDLSAGATDTAKLMVVAEFSSYRELPPGVV